jgi:predicted nucleic acid-binding protein
MVKCDLSVMEKDLVNKDIKDMKIFNMYSEDIIKDYIGVLLYTKVEHYE